MILRGIIYLLSTKLQDAGTHYAHLTDLETGQNREGTCQAQERIVSGRAEIQAQTL